jgi:hypothetical protein
VIDQQPCTVQLHDVEQVSVVHARTQCRRQRTASRVLGSYDGNDALALFFAEPVTPPSGEQEPNRRQDAYLAEDPSSALLRHGHAISPWAISNLIPLRECLTECLPANMVTIGLSADGVRVCCGRADSSQFVVGEDILPAPSFGLVRAIEAAEPPSDDLFVCEVPELTCSTDVKLKRRVSLRQSANVLQ